MSSYRLECKKCHQKFDPWRKVDDETVKEIVQNSPFEFLRFNTVEERLKHDQEDLGCFCRKCNKEYAAFIGDSLKNYCAELERKFIGGETNADIS